MATWADARIGMMMLAGRTMIRTQAWRGDPLAKVLSRRPATDPYPIYDQVRAAGPVHRGRLGLFVTATHEVGNAVLRDSRFGVRSTENVNRNEMRLAGGSPTTLVHPIDDSFLSMDPPSHTRLRRTVGPWFTPRALSQRADRIDQLANDYLDELSGRDRFDLIDDFAVRVPIQIICDLLGISGADYPRFVRWGAEMAASLDGVWTMRQLGRLRVALVEMDRFFSDQITYRRKNPGDDVISGLANSIEGAEPTEQLRQDLVATAGLLLVAGFETTVNLIGNAVVTLLRDPSARDWYLGNLDRSPDLVEEILRLESPVHQTLRIAHEPVEVGGTRIRENGGIIVLVGGANRDPAVFENPNEFNPDRPNNRDHLAFSAGIHYCLGAGLARLEGASALKALFTRFPDLHATGRIHYRRTRNIYGIRHLPLTGRATQPATA